MSRKSCLKANEVLDFCKLQKLWIILPLLFIGTISNVSSVDADHDEDISCHDKGYIDGQNRPFSHGTYNRCGDDYYQGFIEGCMSVQGNDRDICESATDA